MPNYDPTATGVELLVNNNGRPQGRGPLTSVDLNTALDYASADQSNTPAAPPVAGGAPALERYYRIDTVAAAGNNDSQVHPDTGSFFVTDMLVIRTANGDAGDTWRLQVQRQGAGGFNDIFVAACYTAAAGEAGSGDYVVRAAGQPINVANMRVNGGDVLRLVTTNGATNNSSAMCLVKGIGV